MCKVPYPDFPVSLAGFTHPEGQQPDQPSAVLQPKGTSPSWLPFLSQTGLLEELPSSAAPLELWELSHLTKPLTALQEEQE